MDIDAEMIKPELIEKEKYSLTFIYDGITFYFYFYLGGMDYPYNHINFVEDENYMNHLRNNTKPILEIYQWVKESSEFNLITNVVDVLALCYNPLEEYTFKCPDWTLEDYKREFNFLINNLENKYLHETFKKQIIEFTSNPKNFPKEPKPPKPPRIPVPGYIYIIESLGYYKIGKAKNFDNRTKHLSTIMPIDTNFICSFHSEDYSIAETKLHKKYKHLHHKGEWFSLTDKELEEIKSIKDDTI